VGISVGRSYGNDQLVPASLSRLLNQLRHESSPACLVAGANSGAVISVKVLIKQEMVPPLGIPLKERFSAEHRAPSFGIAKKNADQPLRKLSCHLPERRALS
jgi:hypothetical protein